MSASVIQLLSKDRRDSYLTYKPDITFFREPIKQHTPFSIDIIEEEFNKTPNFGDEVFCELSRFGDLIKSMMLKVVIPNVHISKTLDSDYLTNYSDDLVSFENFTLTVDNMIIEYETLIQRFTNFMKSAMVYWRSVKLLLRNTNVNYNTVIDHVNTFINTQNDVQDTYDSYDDFASTKIGDTIVRFNFSILNHLTYDYVSYASSIYNTTLTAEYITVINKYLDDFIFFQGKYLEYLYKTRDKFINIRDTRDTTYYRFAWLSNVGLRMIEALTLEIGGQQIDFHNSITLDKWFKMSTKAEFRNTLNEMLGNVDTLTEFSSNNKPQYELFIPIPFGTLLNKGQTIPVVSTRYQDIIVRVKFEELYNCCYFEPDEFPSYTSNININEEIDIVSASLYVEYVHLSTEERKKFSSKTVEMLVEQHRMLSFSSIRRKNVLLPLDFRNAVKDIFWTIRKKYNVEQMKLWNDYEVFDAFPATISVVGQQEPYLNKLMVDLNGDGFSNTIEHNANDYVGGMCEIYHSKYYNGKYKILDIIGQILAIDTTEFIYPDKVMIKLHRKDKLNQNIVENENILIYGRDLMSRRNYKFFTAVNQRNRSSSSLGIHKHSISIYPEKFQPSSTLNFNVMKNKQLQLELSDVAIQRLEENNDLYIVNITAKNYNTLQVEKGYAKLMFGL